MSIYLVCMAVMATATVTVSSCGDDEKDEIENTVDNSITAVHKIKITVTGNIDKFNWTVHFKGMTWHNNVASVATIYDAKGNAIEDFVENVPDISGETNKSNPTLSLYQFSPHPSPEYNVTTCKSPAKPVVDTT